MEAKNIGILFKSFLNFLSLIQSKFIVRQVQMNYFKSFSEEFHYALNTLCLSYHCSFIYICE